MSNPSILDVISPDGTALERGQKLGEVAAEVGFDWPSAAQAVEKVREELDELQHELDKHPSDPVALADELGDLLFAVVNVARKLDIDAEEAMERTNDKFRARFGYIESEVAGQSRRLDELDLQEMESLWTRAKSAGLEPGDS